MPILYNIYKKKGFFRIPSGGTQASGDCSFSYSAASYKTSDSDPTPTITGDAGGVFSSTVGLVINSATGEITLATSTIASYVVTYTVSGKICTQNLEVTAGAIDNVYSMAFDGIDDYVDTGYTIIAGTDLSVSFWIKTSASTTYTEEYPVVCHALWGTGSSLGRTAQAGTTSRYNKIGSTFGTTQLNDGNWHHVVWTFNDGTNVVNAHVDGNATPDVTGTFTGNYGYDFYIGAFTDSVGAASLWFDGNVDEVAIWNSELSTAEITAIYNDTSTGKTADLSLMTTPPVAWYRMGD